MNPLFLKRLADFLMGKIAVEEKGSFHSPEQAVEALEQTGISLIALGRQLITEPDWVEKVRQGRHAEIRSEIHPAHQKQLEVPDPLWHLMLTVPGWFPVKATEEQTI